MAQANPDRNPCDLYQDCDLQAMSIEQLLFSIFLKNSATGCIFMNVVQTAGDCEDYETIPCDTGDTFLTLLRKSIVVDDCGFPALNIVSLTNGL